MIEEYLKYEPETGNLIWLVDINQGIKKGDVAGTINSDGYRAVCINYRRYKAHRLAWYLYYGKWPEKQIDHINRVKDDNRIENLRDVSHRINNQNKSNFKGGAYQKGSKWVSEIQVSNERVRLGLFDTQSEAQEAYSKFVGTLNE